MNHNNFHFFLFKNTYMKKLFLLILILSLLIPQLSFAEKWDTEIHFNQTTCQVVRYSCDTDDVWEKRYGWTYYADDTGCWCEQILSNKEISTLESKSESLIVAIDVVFPEVESRNKLLKRIKSYLAQKRSNTIKARLLSDIILDKLYNAYWDF